MSYTHTFLFTGFFFFFCKKCGYFQQNINMTYKILKKNFKINKLVNDEVYLQLDRIIYIPFVPHC